VLYIEDKQYIAHDCGSAIKDNCIDVYYTDHNTANQQGVQYLEVFIEVKEEP
jgi:3D (Asp-Asp-Asp) domain-containing protein